jgi:hypothetical protein
MSSRRVPPLRFRIRFAPRRPGVPAKSGARELQRRIDTGIELNHVDLDVDRAGIRHPLSVTRPTHCGDAALDANDYTVQTLGYAMGW